MDAEVLDGQFFEVPEGSEPVRQAPKAPVDKTFRACDQAQQFLLPPSIADWVPEGHLARFIDELVGEVLDLAPFLASCTEVRGYPPYDPRLMLKLLLYGYVTGVRSSRGIEKACSDSVAFRFLSANQAPDIRSIARFRHRHLEALRALFTEGLNLCKAAGMVRLGRVALDGTKRRANASRRKAMSYKRMGETEQRLAQEVNDLLAAAEKVDREEDAAFGENGRDDDLVGELVRRETRLAKIRRAKADLEADARKKAAATTDKARGKDADEAGVTEAAEKAAATAVPKEKAQRNFTDPDSRIMKTNDGSFHYCYNAQAVVDDAHQVVVATRLDNSATDSQAFPEMLDEVIANCGEAPAQVLADAGYFSGDNVEAARTRGIDPLIATGRLHHDEIVPPAPRGRIKKDATPKQRMARKLRTKAGKASYARRKAIVEPVFGQMNVVQGAKHLLLRGTDAASAEWELLSACHNLRKLFVVRGTPRIAPT
ncbi:MAG: IS1182 family transposase [Acidimicrobiales bacterium]